VVTDPWQVITDVMSELLRGGQTADIRCRSALRVLERAGIDFGGGPVAAAVQEPKPARADEFARVKVRLCALVASLDETVSRGTHAEEFDQGAAHASAVTARQLRVILDETALGVTPQAAPDLEAAFANGMRVRTGPCTVDAHDREHFQVRTNGHWLCGHLLASVLIAQGIADAPPAQPVVATTASRLGYALAALREIAEPRGDEFPRDTARNALDDDKAIREGAAVKSDPKPARDDAGTIKHVLTGATWITWDHRKQPPWELIGEAVARLTYGAVKIRTAADEDEPGRLAVAVYRDLPEAEDE